MKTKRIIAAVMTAALALTSAPCYSVTNAADTQQTAAVTETSEFPLGGRTYKFIYGENDETFIVCDGMKFDFSFATGEAKLISAEAAEGKVDIPDSVMLPSYLVNCPPEETKWGALKAPVTEIDEFAFYSNRKITSVTIPDSIRRIGDYAFEECMNLEEIIAPDKYIELGFFAFGYAEDGVAPPWLQKKYYDREEAVLCGNLLSAPDVKEYTVPDGVKAICSAGRLLTKLETLVIPEGVETIKDSFYRCENLKNVTLPQSVSYADDSFVDCNQLKKIKFDGTLSEWSAKHRDINVDPDIYDKNDTLLCIGLRKSSPSYIENPEPYSKIVDTENIKTSLEVGESVEFEVKGRWFRPAIEGDDIIQIEKIDSRPTDEMPFGEIVTYRVTAFAPGTVTFYLDMNAFTIFSDKLEFRITGEAIPRPTGPEAAAFKPEYRKMSPGSGDANCDDKITVADAVAVLQYIVNAERYPLSDKGKENADLDGLEGISGDDVIMIMKLDAGTVIKVTE